MINIDGDPLLVIYGSYRGLMINIYMDLMININRDPMIKIYRSFDKHLQGSYRVPIGPLKMIIKGPIQDHYRTTIDDFHKTPSGLLQESYIWERLFLSTPNIDFDLPFTLCVVYFNLQILKKVQKDSVFKIDMKNMSKRCKKGAKNHFLFLSLPRAWAQGYLRRNFEVNIEAFAEHVYRAKNVQN